MLILSCNVGSTSLKYRLYDMAGERELASGHFEGIGRKEGKGAQRSFDLEETEGSPRDDYSGAILAMLDFLNRSGQMPKGRPDAVAFKVVAALHVSGVVELNEDVLEKMARLNTLLPAHNPPYIAAIRQFMALLPGVPLIGSFETGFFMSMKPEAYLYALPTELLAHGVRKNGAHGASHEYVAQWIAREMGREDVKLVSCHLGGSSSIAAVKGLTGLDTTLGMSLQSGLPHNNRIGDVDPYLDIYLRESLGYTEQMVKDLYSKQGGLLGLSGFSGEQWQIAAKAKEGDARAQTALNVFTYQIKKTIGAFAAALSGLDAIAFTAGIGQNSVLVRKQALDGLQFLGIELDEHKNETAKPGDVISSPNSRVKVYVVATNEEIIIARKARDYLTQ